MLLEQLFLFVIFSGNEHQLEMPKYRKKKKSVAPYDSSKKVNNAPDKEKPDQGTDHLEESLGCDFCKADADNIVQCEKCLSWLCCDCQSISPNMFKAITEFQSLHWYCKTCECQVQEMLNVSLEEGNPVENRLQSIEKQLVDLTTTIKNIVTNKGCHNGAHNEMSDTMQQSTNITTAIDGVNNPPTQTQSIITSTVSSFLTEEKDRERRRLNLILHGVPESSSEDIQTKKEHDSNLVQEILNQHLRVSATIANPIRLGQKNLKPRLLRISVSSDREKAIILRNCTKLRGKNVPDPFCGVYICPDLTFKERENNKKLREQLKILNKDGKTHQIKNGRIVRRAEAM